MNASLNSLTTFICSSSEATSLFFEIDGIPVVQDVNANRGLTQGVQITINGTLFRNLTVEAKAINNNSNVSCTAVGSSAVPAEPSQLMIQGKYVIPCIVSLRAKTRGEGSICH